MNGKVIISRDIIFNEDVNWCCHYKPVVRHNISVDVSEGSICAPSKTNGSFNINDKPTMESGNLWSSNSSTTSQNFTNNQFSEEETPTQRVRSLREIYKSCSYVLTIIDPITYEEATTQKECQEAIKVEIIAIQKMGHGNCAIYQKEKKPLAWGGYLR